MRVGRVPNPTGQQKETTVGMVLAGLGMQVDGRTGGVMGIIQYFEGGRRYEWVRCRSVRGRVR